MRNAYLIIVKEATTAMQDLLKIEHRLSAVRKPVKEVATVISPTQRRAKAILNREKQIEKSSRLFILLNQQYIGKYGSKHPNSNLNDTITQYVRSFLDHNGSPTNDQLVELEEEIAQVSRNFRAAVHARSEERTRQAESVIEEQRQAAKEAMREERARSSGPKLGADDIAKWSVINSLQLLDFESKQAEEKRKAEKKTADFRQALAKQVEFQETRAKELEDEKRQRAQELERLARELAEEERRKKEKQAQRFLHDRDIIMSQIEERKRVKEAEKAEEVAREQREMARARRLAEQEQIERAEEKRKQKEANDRLVLETERDKQRKAELLRRQQEDEKRMQEEYKAKMEREEQARANAFQSRVEALSKIGDSFYTTGAGAIKREAMKREEQMMLDAIQRKEQEDRKKEEMKQRTRSKNLMNAKLANDQLVQQRIRRAQEDREENMRLAEKFKQEALDNSQRIQMEAQKKREAAQRMKDLLDQQVTAKSQTQGRGKKEVLSDIELKLNQDMIKKIEQNPEIQAKIMRKLNPSLPDRDSGFRFG